MASKPLSKRNRVAAFRGTELFPVTRDGETMAGSVDALAQFTAPLVPILGPVTEQAEAAAASAAAAAGAAEATAELQAEITNSYYGSRSADPTTRPDGSAMRAGDRYFYAPSKVEKTFNGAIWMIPNAGAADIANPSDAAKGATLVGKNGDTVSNILDLATRSRGLRTVMDALEPINRLPQKCLLKRLRTDYTDFAIYTPMTADGISWTRWWFSNRTNTGNSGSARMCRASLALLYPGATLPPISENQSSGVEAQAAVVTLGTVSGTRTGSWSTATTVGGVTDVTYSSAVGDKVTYAITGVARIGLRSYVNNANGGIAAVVVRESGVEIASTGYRVPLNGAVRTINYAALNVGQYFVPIADGLDPSKTYTVELTVDSSNPAAGRLYDAGLRGYAATGYNAVGRHGTWFAQVFSAGTTVGTYLSGEKVIYAFAGVTRINWRFVTSANSGKAKFKVYDGMGAEIAAGRYVNTSYDCYLGANNLVTVKVADGLAKGAYYLVIESDTTRNAASTGYRIYDAGVVSYDTTTAGVLGVDVFDDLGLTGLSVEGTSTLIGTGNLELAIKVRKPTDAVGLADFVGGVHGHETNPSSFAMQADGAVADYAGLALGGTLIANTFSWSYDTTLSFPSDSTQFATAHYTGTVSPAGYSFSASRIATAAAVIHEDYSFMFNVPNTAAGTEGLSGGFIKAAVEGDSNYAPGAFNDSVIQFARQCIGMVVWNKDYAAYGFQVNTAMVNEAMKGSTYNPIVGTGGTQSRTLLQDRSDGKFKLYNRAFSGNNAAGIPILPGYSFTAKSVYRTFKASGLDVVLA